MLTKQETRLRKQECIATFKPTPDEDENSIFEVMYHNIIHGGYSSSGGFYKERENAVKAAQKYIEDHSAPSRWFFYPSIIVHQLKDTE